MDFQFQNAPNAAISSNLGSQHAACCPQEGNYSTASTREGDLGQPAQSALHSAATLLCNNARVFLSQGLAKNPSLSASFLGFGPRMWAEHQMLGFAGSRAVSYRHAFKASLLQVQMPSGPGEAPLQGADGATSQWHVPTLEQRLCTGCSEGERPACRSPRAAEAGSLLRRPTSAGAPHVRLGEQIAGFAQTKKQKPGSRRKGCSPGNPFCLKDVEMLYVRVHFY